MPKYLSPTEVVYRQTDIATLSGISSTYLSLLIAQGKVTQPSVKVGLGRFFTEQEKQQILEEIETRSFLRKGE